MDNNTTTHVKRAQHLLYLLRQLYKFGMPRRSYRCTIESVLTSCITAWYWNCSVHDSKVLQRVVKSMAQFMTEAVFPPVQDIYLKRCLRKSRSIINDPTHASHELFTPLSLGRRYRSGRYYHLCFLFISLNIFYFTWALTSPASILVLPMIADAMFWHSSEKQGQN